MSLPPRGSWSTDERLLAARRRAADRFQGVADRLAREGLDREELGRIGHQVHGTAGSYGFAEAAELGRLLEAQARDGTCAEELAAVAARLAAALRGCATKD